MIKVLIADDEEIIRLGLAKLLRKYDDLDIVCCAEDGEIALEEAKEHLPSLLLVDINMPFLNGLEFIERLKDTLTDPVIIIISGYDNFQYVQQALRLKVFDYLLKPVTEEAFYRCIDRAKNQVLFTQKRDNYKKWAYAQLEKNRHILVNSFLDRWLGMQLGEFEVAEQLEYLQISIPTHYGITITHFSDRDSLMAVGHEWDENLLYYAAENIAREVFADMAPLTTYKNSYGDLVIISSCGELWKETAKTLQGHLENFLPIHVIYTQTESNALFLLPHVYEEALDNLLHQDRCPPIVIEAQRYLEAHYQDETLSLQGAARHLHVSPQHLSRLFRSEVGVAFVDFLTKVRIRRAVELLGDNELKMYEIATLVGYSNQHYFSSVFKKALGVSPNEYRKGKELLRR